MPNGMTGTIACCIGIHGMGAAMGMAAIGIGACIGIMRGMAGTIACIGTQGIGAEAGMGIIGLAAMGVAML